VPAVILNRQDSFFAEARTMEWRDTLQPGQAL